MISCSVMQVRVGFLDTTLSGRWLDGKVFYPDETQK